VAPELRRSLQPRPPSPVAGSERRPLLIPCLGSDAIRLIRSSSESGYCSRMKVGYGLLGLAAGLCGRKRCAASFQAIKSEPYYNATCFEDPWDNGAISHEISFIEISIYLLLLSIY
jgi:hypothetical protein